MFFALSLWCLIVVLPTNYSVSNLEANKMHGVFVSSCLQSQPACTLTCYQLAQRQRSPLSDAAQGTEVGRLLSKHGQAAASPFVYWVPPLTTPAPGSTPSGPEEPSPPIKVRGSHSGGCRVTGVGCCPCHCWRKVWPDSMGCCGSMETLDFQQSCPSALQPPKIYEKVPPAPPGLNWWHYAPGVPPLPAPQDYFKSGNWSNWGWNYNDNYQQVRGLVVPCCEGRSLASSHACSSPCSLRWHATALPGTAFGAGWLLSCERGGPLSRRLDSRRLLLPLQSTYDFSTLDRSTMTNISNGSWRLWVHLISAWVVSLYTYKVRGCTRSCLWAAGSQWY